MWCETCMRSFSDKCYRGVFASTANIPHPNTAARQHKIIFFIVV